MTVRTILVQHVCVLSMYLHSCWGSLMQNEWELWKLLLNIFTKTIWILKLCFNILCQLSIIASLTWNHRNIPVVNKSGVTVGFAAGFFLFVFFCVCFGGWWSFIYVCFNTTDFWCFILLQMAEYRVSIYGRKQSEWDQMASWIVNNELYSENVVWLIQVLQESELNQITNLYYILLKWKL